MISQNGTGQSKGHVHSKLVFYSWNKFDKGSGQSCEKQYSWIQLWYGFPIILFSTCDRPQFHQAAAIGAV